MKKLNKLGQEGFTLIEILMTVLIVVILAVVGITQFSNFAADAKNAATKSNLSILRNAIGAKNALERIRCQKVSTDFPTTAALAANSIITAGGACDITTLINPATGLVYGAPAFLSLIPLTDQPFVQNVLPDNPWTAPTATTAHNAVTASHLTAGVCDNNPVAPATLATRCNTAAAAFNSGLAAAIATEAGWCYCFHTGLIWANTANNDGAAAGTGTESLF